MKFIWMLILLIVISIISCGADQKADDVPISPSTGVAFVVTTDFYTGSYSTIDINTLTPYNDLGKGIINSDVQSVRSFNDKIFIVNSYGRDSIQVLDPVNNFQTVSETSMGTYSNPHDIMLVSPDKAYVTRFGSNELWIINPETGVKYDKTIDLSEHSYNYPANNIPYMDKMYYDSSTNYLFVSLQRLNTSWSPVDYGSIIVIDTTTDLVKKEIKLQLDDAGTEYAKNPATYFRFASKDIWQPATADGNAHLLISCVGLTGLSYSEDGGLVAIDLADLHCEKGYILKESEIHMEISDFEIKSNSEIYAVTSKYITNSDSISRLARIDYKKNPISVSVLKTNYSSNDGYGPLWSLSLHSSGRLFLCDRDVFNPGVRVYDTSNGDLPLNNNNPVYVGFPPSNLIFVE
jgi:hypothetical protein